MSMLVPLSVTGDPLNSEEDINQFSGGQNEKKRQEEVHPYLNLALDESYKPPNPISNIENLTPNSSRKYFRRERNLLTDLQMGPNQTIFNGPEFKLRQIYGQHQLPVQKGLHFISQDKVVYLSGNYVALFNLETQNTQYVGIENQLQEITAFEVAPYENQTNQRISASLITKRETNNDLQSISKTTLKEQMRPISNSRGLLGMIKKATAENNLLLNNQEEAQGLNSSYEDTNSSMMHIAEKQQKGPAFGDKFKTALIRAETKKDVPKELLAVVAIAEIAKEEIVREGRFGGKKVISLSNSVAKRLNRYQKQQNPDFSHSKVKIPQSLSPKSNSSSNSLRPSSAAQKKADLADNCSRRFNIRVQVFNLANPTKKYNLQHLFDEYFFVKQIHLRPSSAYCYTLCENQFKDQVFLIWNYKKEQVLIQQELKQPVNKFFVTPQKAGHILFVGAQYIKFWTCNFTNKTMKEVQQNLMSRKLEIQNTFIDVDYIQKKDIFIIISQQNKVFIFQNNKQLFVLHDVVLRGQEVANSVQSDSICVDELSEEENTQILKTKGTMGLKEKKNNNKLSPTKPSMFLQLLSPVSVGKKGALGEKEEDEEVVTKVACNTKGFYIATSQGQMLIYEFGKEKLVDGLHQMQDEPKMMNKIHISAQCKGFASLVINKNFSGDLIAITGVYYHKKESAVATPRDAIAKRFQKITQGQIFPSFIPEATTKRRRKSSHLSPRSFRDSPRAKSVSMQKRTQHKVSFINMFTKQEEQEERLELMVMSLKFVKTLQMSKAVQKIFNKGTHAGNVMQLGIPAQKSCIYSLAAGRNFKIWNHTNDWKGVGDFKFEDQPQSFDIHPSAWQAAFGFRTGLKLFQLHDREMKMQFECKLDNVAKIAYTHGGDLLALATSSRILIFDPLRFQPLAIMEKHSGLVNQLLWDKRSKFLFSACYTGSLYVWRNTFKNRTKGFSEHYPITELQLSNSWVKSFEYEDKLDALVILHDDSNLSIHIESCQKVVYQENLIGQTGANSKPTSMSLSQILNVLALSFSNGRVLIINWPVFATKEQFRFAISLQTTELTCLRFTPKSKFLCVGSGDGSIFMLEGTKLRRGKEVPFTQDTYEFQSKLRQRETNGFRGYNLGDSAVLLNEKQIQKVDQKIAKMEQQVEKHVFTFEYEKKQMEERIQKETEDTLQNHEYSLKQNERDKENESQNFFQEQLRLNKVIEEQKNSLKDAEEKLRVEKEEMLTYMQDQNDRMEGRIARQTEANNVDKASVQAVHLSNLSALSAKYEKMINKKNSDINNQISNMKNKGYEYENYLADKDDQFDDQLDQLHQEFLEQQEIVNEKLHALQDKDEAAQDSFEAMDEDYKSAEKLKAKTQNQRQETLKEVKYLSTNLDRLNEKQVASEVFINEKEQLIEDIRNEKERYQNVIIFLSDVVRDMETEREPMIQRQKQMEQVIEESYKELTEEFESRKQQVLKVEEVLTKVGIAEREIVKVEELKEQVIVKFNTYKKELKNLSGLKGDHLKGWANKIQAMLKTMITVAEAKAAIQIKKIDMKFLNLFENQEGGPPKEENLDREYYEKMQKMTQKELTYIRNQRSKKMEEVKTRFDAVMKQMEKSTKRLRQDNIRLIQEFNLLTREGNRLANLKSLIERTIEEVADIDGINVDDNQNENSFEQRQRQRQENQEFNNRAANLSQTINQKIQNINSNIENLKTEVGGDHPLSICIDIMRKDKRSKSQFEGVENQQQSIKSTEQNMSQVTRVSNLQPLNRNQSQKVINSVNIGQNMPRLRNLRASRQSFGNQGDNPLKKRIMINSLTARKETQPKRENEKFLDKIMQDIQKNKQGGMTDRLKNLGKPSIPVLDLLKAKQRLEQDGKFSLTTRLPVSSQEQASYRNLPHKRSDISNATSSADITIPLGSMRFEHLSTFQKATLVQEDTPSQRIKITEQSQESNKKLPVIKETVYSMQSEDNESQMKQKL